LIPKIKKIEKIVIIMSLWHKGWVVCSHALVSHPVELGGENYSDIIEIDESLFGKKRKCHRGTGKQHMWIFEIHAKQSCKLWRKEMLIL
jgi:hypothetical protein